VKLTGLHSKRTGTTYDAMLVLECKEDGLARFHLSFDDKKAPDEKK